MNKNVSSEVDNYISQIPDGAIEKFKELRQLVREELPKSREVLSYGIVGYKIDDKRARVFISGWRDHLAVYPVPDDEELRQQLNPYIKSKGTLWFPLDEPLPRNLIKSVIRALS